MDNMLEELNCPICLEFFTCPVILPCSHILCRSPCAERLFEQNFIRCPVCRDNCYVAGGIDVLPRVISLENIIERYQEEEDIEDEDDDGEGNTSIGGVPCQLCTSQHARRAKKSCMDCNASYCSNCLEITHPNREPFNQHTLVAPTRNPRPKVVQCSQHREVVNAYCVSCKMLACAVCVHAGVHQGHRLLPVDEAFQELRSSLEVSMKSTESSQEAAAEAVKSEEDQLKVYQEIAARRRQDIDEQCNSLIAFIEAKRRFFHSDLDLEEQGQVAAVRVAVNDHKKLTAESQSLVHYAKLVMKETDPASFLQIAGTINERLIKSCGRVEELHMPPVETEKMRTKILDLRKQKAIMKDMQYLTAPQSPAIDVTKCSRSSNCVILVLSKNSGYEVVDGYHVLYCAEGEETETPQVWF
ncbi:E3 ubiquitin-protein ligase Midline-1-like [Lingula anatina]|uniref:E3 ubiquitin-protein ligase Midline-1-like n=1 Tax=Lingula anatina TaxID=7574 RepID=A0A1S3K296_LINAN|nr:E3 ubiquitin-protein ligase Midline-1-like [Lingula anatina]|eukprot:XP_013416396.1 E3 ubiquitin-protein ligase Midline-1-like [Lingula anatina]